MSNINDFDTRLLDSYVICEYQIFVDINIGIISLIRHATHRKKYLIKSHVIIILKYLTISKSYFIFTKFQLRKQVHKDR